MVGSGYFILTRSYDEQNVIFLELKQKSFSLAHSMLVNVLVVSRNRWNQASCFGTEGDSEGWTVCTVIQYKLIIS